MTVNALMAAPPPKQGRRGIRETLEPKINQPQGSLAGWPTHVVMS